MARRELAPAVVEYSSQEPSAFAQMLGGLIEANVKASPKKRHDFDQLVARVGIWVTDIDEGVTLVFDSGRLSVYNGLEPRRTITMRAEAETVMSLSNLKIGIFGLPVYYDEVGRGVASRLLLGKLKIDGMLQHVATLNRVTSLLGSVTALSLPPTGASRHLPGGRGGDKPVPPPGAHAPTSPASGEVLS